MADKSTTSRHAARNPASGLTREEEDHLRGKLLALQSEFRTRHDQHLAPAREGDGEEPDALDRASLAQDHAIALEIAEHENIQLGEIDAALARLEDGTYGVCEGTGEPIGKKRLEAQPWTRYSVAYLEMLEKDAEARRRLGA